MQQQNTGKTAKAKHSRCNQQECLLRIGCDQKFPTSADFICSWSLSAISAMNSELVGFPLVLDTVYPKNRWRVSRSPRSHATSMACLIARSTLDGVVWKVFATWGYSTLVMAFVSLTGHAEATKSNRKTREFCRLFIALFVGQCTDASSGL